MRSRNIYDNFKEIVEKTPKQTAIVEERRALTYAQLDRRAGMIASGFPSREKFIGIVADHGADLAKRCGAGKIYLEASDVAYAVSKDGVSRYGGISEAGCLM